MKVLVTGCYGFIASHLIKYLSNVDGVDSVMCLGRDTSQMNRARLSPSKREDGDPLFNYNKLRFVHGNIQDTIGEASEGVDVIFHLAAKTFVDHSIRDFKPFVHDNVGGTLAVLEAARQNKIKKVIIQSTDEVYGQILDGAYKEDARLNPRNPYAAAKASADMFALAFHHTYGLDVTIARLENVYGTHQNPQKVIPNFVKCAMIGKPIPIYGDGKHIRQWIHVEDNVCGLVTLIDFGKPGEVYHVAGNQEVTNLELANIILHAIGKEDVPIEFIEDHNIRPGHDRRYALDSTKMRSIGWKPNYNLESGIGSVARWYKYKLIHGGWY